MFLSIGIHISAVRVSATNCNAPTILSITQLSLYEIDSVFEY